jgi:hypothetical protein
MTWRELTLADRHGLGSETLPVDQIKLSLPALFSDRSKVTVFRYCDKLPMLGIRVDDTFHLLAIEARFNTLYDHD